MMELDRNEICDKTFEFADEYPHLFEDWHLGLMKDIILNGEFPYSFRYDYIRELCDEFGVIPDKDNIYLTFIDELRKRFDIENRNIIEVGGGMIPCLGRRINLLQTNGSLTIYDPRLIDKYEDKPNYKLVREMFTLKSPIGNTDLLIGLMPCGGANELIEMALRKNIEFMLWLCEGGPHGDEVDWYESADEWISGTIAYASRHIELHNLGEFEVFNKPEFSEYPIIYYKKK